MLFAQPSWVVSSALQVPLLLLPVRLRCLVALDGSFTQLDSGVNIWHLVTCETMFPWTYQRAWSDYLTLLILLFDNYLFPVDSLKLAEERVFRGVWFGLNLTVLLWFLRKYLWQQHFLIGDWGSDIFSWTNGCGCVWMRNLFFRTQLGKLLYFLPSCISQELTFVYLYGVVTLHGAEWNR